MVNTSLHMNNNLEQKLNISPDLLQQLNLLQNNHLEIMDVIKNEFEENPFLEIEEKNLSSDNLFSLAKSLNYYNRNSNDYSYNSLEQCEAHNLNLTEYVQSQIGLIKSNSLDLKVLNILALNLDESGYLDTPLLDISKEFNIDLPLLESNLKTIQSLDPKGIGARNLSECLLLQLNENDLNYIYCKDIIKNHLILLASNNILQLSKKLKVNLSKAQFLSDYIKTLDPKPGHRYSHFQKNNASYIVPEFTLKIENNTLNVSQKETLYPKLIISNYYTKLLKSNSDPKCRDFLTIKYNNILKLLKNIEKRKETLINVATEIIKFQKNFFLNDFDISPMTLKDISDSLEIHQSTVSRAVNNKFIDTPKGTYSLKFFFSNHNINTNNSYHYILDKIKEIVENEEKSKPLSDIKISEKLQLLDIKISRRTITKYREQLNIRSSNYRRAYK